MDEIKELVEAQVEQSAQEESPVEQPKNERIEQNLAAMRKKLEAAEERERDAERRAQEAERRYSGNQPQSQAPQEEDEYGDPDGYVETKQYKKTAKQFTSKLSESEQKLAALEQKLAYMEAKSELDALKDFNDVVTDDNLKTFARLYPDDYETMMANPNLKSKSKTAYNMIKNYGIANAAPLLKQNDQIRAVEKKIESNKARPAVAAQASASPLIKAGRYNEEGRLILSDADAKIINAETLRKINGVYNS